MVWDLACHDISILTYILEQEPLNVSARGKSFIQKGIEDFAFVDFEFPNDVVTHVRVGWLFPFKERKLTIIGSKKTLVYDDTNSAEPISIYNRGIDWLTFERSNQQKISYRDHGVSCPKVSSEEPLRIECQHFIDCIRENKTPLTNGQRGIDVLKILTLIQKSLDSNGHLIKVK